jgi:hypothetical protein
LELSTVNNQDYPVENQPSAIYDEQLGLTFTQNFTSMAYNITAVAQADSNGYGPGYLLCGLTDTGYWYQVGLSWNWPFSSGGYASGFSMNYEVFDPSGNSIYPASGGGISSFSGAVNKGDTVLLNLFFSGGDVVMQAYDYNTGAGAVKMFNQEGSSYFIGLTSSPTNSIGFWTGLMTEWWHSSTYYGGEANVTYWENNFAQPSAWMWMDEWVPSTGQLLFLASTNTPVAYTSPNTLQYVSSHNATEASDGYQFTTGVYSVVTVNMNYLVQGGGSGYSAPSFTYSFGGIQYSIQLSTNSTTYYMDTNSLYSFQNPLPGSSVNERWATQSATGVVSASTSFSVTYYHQYRLTSSYTTVGRGAPSAPNLTLTQFGSTAAVSLFGSPTDYWADSGQLWSVSNPLQGSSSVHRWYTQDVTSGTVSAAQSVLFTYYDQYYVLFSFTFENSGQPGYTAPTVGYIRFGSQMQGVANFTDWADANSSYSFTALLAGSDSNTRWIAITGTSGTVSGSVVVVPYYFQVAWTLAYSMSGGGSPAAPLFSGLQNGVKFSPTLMSMSISYWFDYGSSWSVTNPLSSSNSSERWITSQTDAGAVSGPTTATLQYYHQYYVQVLSNSQQGGFVSPLSDWFNSSEQVQLSAASNGGWQFEFWNGSGVGSYGGVSNPFTVTVRGPIFESAMFYPGLSVVSSSFGSVSYSSASLAGKVGGASNRTLFVPLGSTVQLAASPAFFLFKFDGWSGATSSSETGVSVVVNSAESLQASFSINWVIASILIVLIAVVLVAVVVLWRVVLPRRVAGKHGVVRVENPKPS